MKRTNYDVYTVPFSTALNDWHQSRQHEPLLDDGLLDELRNPPPEPADDGEYDPTGRLAAALAPYLHRLPAIEADVLQLYYIKHTTQNDLANMFACSQANISYMISRATQRLRFLIEYPELSEAEIRRDLTGVLDPLDVEIACALYATGVQSHAAAALGWTQGRVRHRLLKFVVQLDALRTTNPALEPYFKAFSMCLRPGRLLRRLILPQWRRAYPDAEK
jgi:Sigma-70, region 4